MVRKQTNEAIFPEPFLESAPQALILFVLVNTHANLFLNSDPCKSPIVVDELFVTTFFTSIVTASLGIARFLRKGPTRIVNNDRCFRGIGTLTYFLIFINVVLAMFGRGFVISEVVTYVLRQEASKTYYLIVLLYFMPQLLHVS